MLSKTRSLAVAVAVLAGCAGNVREADDDFSQGSSPATVMTDGGLSDGAMNGGNTSANNGSPQGQSGDAGMSSNDNGTPPVNTPQGNPADTCKNGTEALTSGLRIKEISLYQVVKIPLFQNGAWVTSRIAKVVQGKKALVRVFVEPQAGYSAHSVRGVLTLDNGSMPKYVTADATISGASTDSALGTTFNFNLEPADVGASTKISVSLVEPSCPSTLGKAADARFPASGSQALDATKINKLRVVVVPVTLSGRTPDTSAAQLAKMREGLLAYYPVPDVEVTARAPITYSGSVSASGGGWSDLLNQIINTRRQDGPATDIYYFGLITPAASFMGYCGFGCVLGLAPQNDNDRFRTPDQQAGLGVGYVDDRTYTTMVHELGHAHGRGHAPCAQGGSIQGVDGNFPYKDGGIGVWGWDSRSNTLQVPTATKDIMGYCEPTWISDYTYEALAKRSLDVNTQARVSIQPGMTWESLILYADGGARWGGMQTTNLPGGAAESATVLDAQGNTLEQIEVYRVTLSHSDDSFAYMPRPQADWATVVLSDRTLTLSQIAAPR